MTELWPLVPIAAIVGFWFYLISLSQAKARVRELQVRERIALIEKGMMPAPEVDPRGFDRAVDRYEYSRRGAPNRHRSVGIALIGVGLGLMVMIGFAGEAPQQAVGVGGSIAILGAAFIVNSLFDQRQLPDEQPKVTPPTPSAPLETPKID